MAAYQSIVYSVAAAAKHAHIWTQAVTLSLFIACISEYLCMSPLNYVRLVSCLVPLQRILAKPLMVGLKDLEYHDPCGSQGRCRIGPPRFLAVCRTRRLNQG